jgi:hypothetical protein
MKNVMLAVGAVGVGIMSAAAGAQLVSNYDDLAEGFYGPTFEYNGVTYRDVNGVPGAFPSGETFEADYPGENLIIENATFLYNDFPEWGSAPNALTFGNAFIPGDNLSIGGFSRASMDFDQVMSSVSMDMVFYENGPWGGIVFHLDGLRDGEVVAGTTYTIADGGGRDNPATTTLSITGEFDSVNIYATWGKEYSAPRLMIDDLTLTPAGGGCAADFNADGEANSQDFFDFLTAFFAGC